MYSVKKIQRVISIQFLLVLLMQLSIKYSSVEPYVTHKPISITADVVISSEGSET